MKKAWRTLAAVGFTGAFALGGCVIGSSDDDGTGGSGGSGGKGGSPSSGGAPAGGAAGSSLCGSSEMGTGGAAGCTGAHVCEHDRTAWQCGEATIGTCEVPQGAEDPLKKCLECMRTKCCNEMKACTATNPNNPCWHSNFDDGTGQEVNEFICMVNCMRDGTDIVDCGDRCQATGCNTIDPATSEAAACADDATDGCAADCLQ
jgi:hypothetical protein